MGTVYFCADERRRNEVAGRDDLNGIDFLEVFDPGPAGAPPERQRILLVHLVNDPTGLPLGPDSVRVDGGDRIRGIRVTAAAVAVDPRAATTDPVLVVEVDRPGDFSTYTLSLVDDPDSTDPPAGIDPVLASVEFSFKVNCPAGFDCRQAVTCPPHQHTDPAIDYLARDYASFRQLMLDRLAVVAPGWTERSPADLGVALVELLAHAGDLVSYRQDAIATESHLGTARSRVSARRHARLVDYRMHDGCNARSWLRFEVTQPVDLDAGTAVLTRSPALTAPDGRPLQAVPGSRALAAALDGGAQGFQTMHTARLLPGRHRLRFHTWGARECCLPRGATAASLRGDQPAPEPGDVVVLAEVRSPLTGLEADADLTRRHPVRVTAVRKTTDPIGGRFDDPPTDDPVGVVEIRWGAGDALPFPLRVSAVVDGDHRDDLAEVWGNIVLADHGLPVTEDVEKDPERWVVPAQGVTRHRAAPDPIGNGHGGHGPTGNGQGGNGLGGGLGGGAVITPPRFRPRLTHGPLTQAAPYGSPPAAPTDPGTIPPAAAAGRFDPRDALPRIRLTSQLGGAELPWSPKPDLLGSGPEMTEFVVEVEADGRAFLRFGDGERGARPQPGSRFTEVAYRVGNGAAGNVGAGSLVHLVGADARVVAVANPLPAAGGTDPEPIASVREHAPSAFQVQRRAVTPADYAAFAAAHERVQSAAGTLRWTGSWHTVFVTADPVGGGTVDAELEGELRGHLEPLRLAGHDLEIDSPRLVAVDLALEVDVEPGYFRGDVERAFQARFSDRVLPDGTLGLFHPDRLAFGQAVHLSPLVAAAQATGGVRAVRVTAFQRRDRPGDDARRAGVITLGKLEVARLDNDPSHPDRGSFTLTLRGGA